MNPVDPIITLSGIGDQAKKWLQEIIDERLQWLVEESAADDTDPHLNIELKWTSDTTSLKVTINIFFCLISLIKLELT